MDQFLVKKKRKRKPYIGDPAKDFCIETYMILRDIHASLEQDLLLEGTAVICTREKAGLFGYDFFFLLCELGSWACMLGIPLSKRSDSGTLRKSA